jgi:limonene-1,2-epoxide hydrolase
MTNQPSAQRALLDQFFAAVERFDWESAFACLTDDCRYQNMPDPGSVHVGAKAARRLLESFFSATQANQFVQHKVVEQGQVIISERTDRHHLKDGRWVELPVTGVFEFRDGKIAAWRDYFDSPTLYRDWPGMGGGA